MIKLDFHLINLTQTLGDKVYEFKSKGGRILLLGLIAGFIARGQGYIDWSNWGIVWRSLLACLAWDILTFVIFFIASSFRMKKYAKEMEELEKEKAKTVDTLAHMMAEIKQIQKESAVVDEYLSFRLENLKETTSNELSDMIAKDETFHCMMLHKGGQYSQCTIKCSGEENRYFAVFKNKSDAEKFWPVNSQRISKELYFDGTVTDVRYAAVKTREFEVFLKEEDSGGLALITDGKIIKMTCREVLEALTKSELEKAQNLKRLTEELSQSKSIPTQELFSQITDNVYAITYNVYDEVGNATNVLVTMTDKTTGKDRLAICRDTLTSEVIWNIIKEKLDAGGKVYDSPTLKALTLSQVRMLAELTAKDGVLNGIYFCNNAIDQRSISLEELKNLIK